MMLGVGDLATEMEMLLPSELVAPPSHPPPLMMPSPPPARCREVPQWGLQETRDLIAIRGDSERLQQKGLSIWDDVAAKMRERGHARSAEQCKCKWKCLLNKYKRKETSSAESDKKCPFFDELHYVFTERARSMERPLIQSESGSTAKRKWKGSGASHGRSSEELSEDEEEDVEDSVEGNARNVSRKVDDRRRHQQTVNENPRGASCSLNNVLLDFLQQQEQMDIHWQEAMEQRARERQMSEQQWRREMERIERERVMLEQAWLEREEERRMREEARAEQRDALLTTLLNKILQDNL